jgi:hypothetical protein
MAFITNYTEERKTETELSDIRWSLCKLAESGIVCWVGVSELVGNDRKNGEVTFN